MCVSIVAGVLGAAGAVAGGIAGALKGPARIEKNLAPKSDLEIQAEAATGRAMSSFSDLMEKGPGASDVEAGTQSQRDLGAMLADYTKTGGMPGAEDISTGQTMAGRLFAGQRQAQSENFIQQGQQYNAQAALMGRSPLDPVMRNKLMQEQTRQQAQLQADQFGFGTQLALQAPDKKLGYAQGRATVLGGLASQAMANRQALFAMGSAALGQQQKFRSDTAGETHYSGGEGAFNAISGAIGGLGAGMSAGKDFASIFGGEKMPNQAGNVTESKSNYKYPKITDTTVRAGIPQVTPMAASQGGMSNTDFAMKAKSGGRY